MNFRNESDTLGPVQVPAAHLWGAQTQRAVENFRIGTQHMPLEMIHAYAIVKKSAALANAELKVLENKKAKLIEKVCDEILSGKLNDEFPLPVWQSGSGTQTNMNVNEVIVNRAHILSGGKLTDSQKILHPNDDVNASQSSNDTFPAAMHIAALQLFQKNTLPNLQKLQKVFAKKAQKFQKIVKIGRTHLMDATPLTLGQEFSAYAAQLEQGIRVLKNSFQSLAELPLGGTAVGTGLNAPKDFAKTALRKIAAFTNLPFVPAKNKFAGIAAHDALVEAHGALKLLAVILTKIANDIRLLASGPRCGLGELQLPANEPGSSIMPGKVNPTQCEALMMACAQIIGNDVAVTLGGMSGQLQLNTSKPLIIFNILTSGRLLGDSALSFAENCVNEIVPHTAKIAEHLENSLMLVTALTPHIGYAKAAKIAQEAYKSGKTLRAAALASGELSAAEFEAWVDPRKMI